MLFAVEGCCHGELDSIYASLSDLEQRHAVKVDVLLICGDFQAVRNAADLATMACPPKYRSMQTFYKYYTGAKVAPVLTIVIGGNHEASNHLWELYYGGWLAPNIFFLGYAGVVNIGGVRIGGLTGIYNRKHYQMGHYEAPPFSDDDMRSTYHVRELEALRLKQLRQPCALPLFTACTLTPEASRTWLTSRATPHALAFHPPATTRTHANSNHPPAHPSTCSHAHSRIRIQNTRPAFTPEFTPRLYIGRLHSRLEHTAAMRIEKPRAALYAADTRA